MIFVATNAQVFVTALSRPDAGISKLVQVSGQIAHVAYFDTPSPEGRIYREWPVRTVRPVRLMRQTRAFYQDESESWRVGRVLDGLDDPILEKPPRLPISVEGWHKSVWTGRARI